MANYERFLDAAAFVDRPKKEQIPKIFDLFHILPELEAVRLCFPNDQKKQDQEMLVLLTKHLKTLYQEHVFGPLSPPDIYEVEQDGDTVTVHDRDYPAESDIVKRANPDWAKSTLAQVFIDRFKREGEQIKLLVEALNQDQLLWANPTIEYLSQLTADIEFEYQGKKLRGTASQWYALGMPATAVHKGGGSYFNIYRLIRVKDQYYVQTQAYYHRLSLETQVDKLLNLDQNPAEYFIPKDEEEFMRRIIKLHPRRSKQDPQKVLMDIAWQAGDYFITPKVWWAQLRQWQQGQTLTNGAQVFLKILKKEVDKPRDAAQKARLDAVVEAVANPTLSNRRISVETINAIEEKYDQVLVKGQGRDEFVKSLVSFIPSIVNRVSGWTLCGAMSAGGLNNLAANGSMFKQLHGFGGLNLEAEACNAISCTNPKCIWKGVPLLNGETECPKCHWQGPGHLYPHEHAADHVMPSAGPTEGENTAEKPSSGEALPVSQLFSYFTHLQAA